MPLFPPTPFSHTGRRWSLGVLKPKTSEGTQAPPKKPILVRCTSVPPACPPAARVPPPPGCAGVPSQRERSWARYAVCGIPVRVCSLIPPTPFSHKVRRGSLGVLMAETGDGTQGLAKKSTPVRYRLGGIAERFTPDGARQPAQADFAFHSRGLYSCGSSRYRISFSIFMFAHRASPA